MVVPNNPITGLLLKYLRPNGLNVLLLGALLLSGLGLQLVNPQIVRSLIDSVSTGSPTQSLVRLALFFIGVAFLSQIALVLATSVGERVAWRATNALRKDLCIHCLNLDVSFHHARSPGEMIERIDGDVTLMANFFSQFAIRVVGNLILLTGIILLLWREDWLIGLPLTLCAAGTLAVLNRIRRIAVPYWISAREANAKLFGFIEERLRATEDLRPNGATDYVMNGLYRQMRELLNRDRQAAVTGAVTWTSTIALFTLVTAIAMGLVAYLYLHGLLTLGSAYLVYAYAEMLRRPIEQITQQVQDLQRATASVKRVTQLLGTKSQVEDEAAAELPTEAPSVSFDHVMFGYSADTPVLSDLSFELPGGRVLALLGATGSGKSTIARLLMRFYDPQSGAVRIGGQDLRRVGLLNLRDSVALVTQDVQLFKGTVRDNLTFFHTAISDAQILETVRQLEVSEWFSRLPNGLDTELGASGAGLSAGEGQLLAFVRVALRNPSVVILDEASALLDPATERMITKATERLLVGRTSIIIAHHLSTVGKADEVMILDHGQVVERGPRAVLAVNPESAFSRLLRAGMEASLT